MPSARMRTRHLLPSDSHVFVGRIFDLSIVALHFDSFDELSKYPDCKYAIQVNHWLSGLVQRVESLNMAGNLIWPNPMSATWNDMPISRHEWLTVAMDVFLLRYVSVIDCALILANEVFEIGLSPEKCTLNNLRQRGLPRELSQYFSQMLNDQETLRLERNQRIHHGSERPFTKDDATFKMASMFEHRGSGLTGRDRFGREINIERFFREALDVLQRDFNRATRRLVKQLNGLYDLLGVEFESRFAALVSAATHGLNAGGRSQVGDRSSEA